MSAPDDPHARKPQRPERTPALAALCAWLAHGRGRWPLLALAVLFALVAMALLAPERSGPTIPSAGGDGNAVRKGGAPDATGERVAGAAPVCGGLLEHSAWTGRIAFANTRDIRTRRLDSYVTYDQRVDVSASLPEHTRRQHRGRDASVRYANPAPGGTIDFTYAEGDDVGHQSFKADGGLRPHEEGMPEGGSMLSITLKSDCSYAFHFYGHATGSWTESSRSGERDAGKGTLRLLAVSGYGTAGADGTVRGSGDFQAWPDPLVGKHAPDGTSTVIEYDAVHRALGNDMGTIHVEWDFRPAP